MIEFTEIDKLVLAKPKETYEELKKIYDSNEQLRNNINLLWRLGRACFLWANSLQKKDPRKKSLIHEGRSYASKAYAIDENDFEALRWMAILIGSATDFMGPKEKIEQGKIFKAYLDRAIDQQPNEYSLLHSRGRFTFEIANLSWLEKKLCNTLFSRIPDTNINDALADFLEAEKYAPFIWPENLLYVTRCYVILKQRELALKYLHKVETMQNLDDAETEALMEVRCAVAKLK